jgi:hypothetical protein
MELINKKFLGRSVEALRFLEYLQKLLPIELDLKHGETLEALGLCCVTGCPTAKFYVNFGTGVAYHWDHNDFSAIGSGEDVARAIFEESKKSILKYDDPVLQHSIFCNTFIATQTCQEGHLNLERLVGGAPYGVFTHNDNIWWAPERTVITLYSATNVLSPGSVHAIGAHRIAHHKGSLFSFSLDIENRRAHLVRRINSTSRRCDVDDWKAQMTLNSKYLSVNGFYGALSSQNIAGITITRLTDGLDFFEEQLDVSLILEPGDVVKLEKFVYNWRMTDFGRDTFNKAFVEIYGSRASSQ